MNMDYCKFENTVLALQQCIDGWEGNEDEVATAPCVQDGLSERERQARRELVELCQYIVETLNEDE